MKSLVVKPSTVTGGRLQPPGDKSISHRAAIFSLLTDSVTSLYGFSPAADCQRTLDAIRQLGATVTVQDDGAVRIEGRGFWRLLEPQADIDCGNSGTLMRLLTGLLAPQSFNARLVGDESLSRRPMQRVADPLREMGAAIELSEAGTAPVSISGRTELEGMLFDMPLVSAQVKSAVMLAALYADAPSMIREKGISRDHTERMLVAFGGAVKKSGNELTIKPFPALVSPGVIHVPADLSAAAFAMVLTVLSRDAVLELPVVGVNRTRDGIIHVLQRMGADIQVGDVRYSGSEPQAAIRVHASHLQGVDIGADDVALAIDEIPILLIAAAMARGVTRLSGAAELRVKESDRLAAMAEGLRTLGIPVVETPDGLELEGGRFSGGEVDSHGDHRIAMAFAIAGAFADAPVTIRNTQNIETSYPGFVADMRQLGLDIEEI